MIERSVERVAAPRADEVAPEISRAPRGVEEVHVELLRGFEAREVINRGARAEPAGQQLVCASLDVIAADRIQELRRAIGLRIGCLMLIQHVGAEEAVGRWSEVEAILAADALSGLRIPVVQQRDVL